MYTRNIFSWITGILCCSVAFFAAGLPAQSVKSLTFDEAFGIAKDNSPDIRQARYSLKRGQELLNAQEASLKSKFSLSLEPFYYSRAREFDTFFSTWNTTEIKSYTGTFSITQPVVWTDGQLALRNQFGWRNSNSEFLGTQSETFSNNLFISYDQPIFTYNRTKLALDEVKLDLENSQLNYQVRELQLETTIAQAFYSAFQSKMSLQVAKEEYQNRQNSYDIIKNKVDAGLAAQEELYQAELDRTSSESQVQNNQVSLDNALDELKHQLGLEITDEITVVGEITQNPVKIDLDKALAYGLRYRLELRQRDIDLVLSQNNVTRAAATNEFLGNVSLQYGLIGEDETLNRVFDEPTNNQRASITFEVPIYDWGEQKSRIRAAEASVDQSKLDSEEQKKQIIISIRRAYRNIQNQALQIELARRNVESAQLTYDINLERYKNGDLTSMDLNLFQNQLSQKKIDLVNTMISYKLDLLDLKIQSLWDFEKDRAAVELKNDQ